MPIYSCQISEGIQIPRQSSSYWIRNCITCLFALSSLALFGCGKSGSNPTGSQSSSEKTQRSPKIPLRPKFSVGIPSKSDNRPFSCAQFVESQSDANLTFQNANGAVGKALMVESTGGGAGWLDFDGDGRSDLYLVQGGNPVAKAGDPNPGNRLKRNINGTEFEDITKFAKIGHKGYGQGVAVGDFNNDGFDDLYVTNVGSNVLYQNQGDGTFQEVTTVAGVDDKRWSSSAAWGDLDLDGDLDLFVCNYLKYDPFNPLPCPAKDGTPAVCHPSDLDPVSNACFMNQGDGTFLPIAKEWGLQAAGSKSLGVVIADMDGDGLLDVFVANDTEKNFLFVNKGENKFEELGVSRGCALNGQGSWQASMGIATGDYNRDGHLDLYVTHFTDDSNTLYRNLGKTGFQDVTRIEGLHQPTLKYLAFGTVMADFNLDGQQELFITNGHIDDWRSRGELYKMPAQLISYSAGRWKDCGDQAGPFFKKRLIGRGVAAADYDNDGDYDLAVIHQNAPMALLKNESERGHWLSVRLTGRASNRRGIGAKIEVQQEDLVLVQQLVGGGSYCSANQPLAIFGFGKSNKPCSLTVRWPSGIIQELKNVSLDHKLELIEPEK